MEEEEIGRKAKTERRRRRKLISRGVDIYLPTYLPLVTGNRIGEDREGQKVVRTRRVCVCVRVYRTANQRRALYRGCIPTFARG